VVVQSTWCGVYGFGFRVYGLWFGVYGLWIMDYGLWFMETIQHEHLVYGLWFRVSGFGVERTVWLLTHVVSPHACPLILASGFVPHIPTGPSQSIYTVCTRVLSIALNSNRNFTLNSRWKGTRPLLSGWFMVPGSGFRVSGFGVERTVWLLTHVVSPHACPLILASGFVSHIPTPHALMYTLAGPSSACPGVQGATCTSLTSLTSLTTAQQS
jgi:hypothetical protein